MFERTRRQRRFATGRKFWFLSALLIGAAASPEVAAQVYEVVDLGTLGGAHCYGYDVNNRGEVVGTSRTAAGVDHAFLWQNGSMTDLTPTATNNAAAYGLNNHGQVVGSYRAADFQYHAFLWDAGTFTDLHPQGEPNESSGIAINEYGEIAGRLPLWPSPGRPGVWRNGAWHALEGDGMVRAINNEGVVAGVAVTPPPQRRGRAGIWEDGVRNYIGPDWSDASDINDHGMMVGGWYDGEPGHPDTEFVAAYWLREESSTGWTYPATVIGTDASLHGVNNRGQIVGSYLEGGEWHAALWEAGQRIDLQSRIPAESGWTLHFALEINDRGDILCIEELEGGGAYRTCLLRPEDFDGDGLLDVWEANGIDVNDDGTIDLDLAALGAQVGRKDLFVEIDAMVGRAPSSSVLQMVETAFANAPVANPDMTTGISLHLLVDETDIPLADWPDAWAGFDAVKAARFGTPAQRGDANAANILAAKRLAYRYCVFANTYNGTTSSGLAELPGNDFMVTLGGWYALFGAPTEREEAGTLMHELGHTLGLKHGGDNHVNYKPNFYSVMNYRWQMPAGWMTDAITLLDDWQLDYSRERLPTLSEAALFEPIGFGPTPARYDDIEVLHWTTGGALRLQTMRSVVPADWNNNGFLNGLPVAVDLNRNGDYETLRGHEDWSAITYAVTGSLDFADGVHHHNQPEPELTLDDWLEINEAAAIIRSGDVNCDGVLNNFDIDPFVLALTDRDAYTAAYPDCTLQNADANEDSVINNFDIDVFVELLIGE